VWTDVNQNGLSEAGELQPLGSGGGGSSLGITSISLTSDHQAFGLPDGSRIEGLGTFTRNGATFALADAALAYDTVGFKKVPTVIGFNYLSENGTVKVAGAQGRAGAVKRSFCNGSVQKRNGSRRSRRQGATQSSARLVACG
jgi:hypothetical protein